MKLAEHISQLDLDVEHDPIAVADPRDLVPSGGPREPAAKTDRDTSERSGILSEQRPAASSAARASAPPRRTRRSVPAPALIGSAAAPAIEQLRSCGLNPAVELQETDERSERGTVIAQEPQAGEELARGATVALWVGAPRADQIVEVDAAAELTAASTDAMRDAAVTAECEAQRVDALDDGWFDLPHADAPSSDPGAVDQDGAPVAAPVADQDEPDSSDAAPDYASPTQRRIRYSLATIAAGVLLLLLGRALMPQQDTPPPQNPKASSVPASVRHDTTGAASATRDESRVVPRARPRPAPTIRPRSRRALHRRAARSRRAPGPAKSTSAGSRPVAASAPTAGHADAAPRSLPHIPASPRPRQSRPPSSSSRTAEPEFFTP